MDSNGPAGNNTWKVTSQKKAESRKTSAFGCVGCLGYLLILVAVVATPLATNLILGAENDNLSLAARLLEQLSLPASIYDNIATISFVFALSLILIGSLIVYFLIRSGHKKTEKRYAEAQITQKEFDLAQQKRWKRYKSVSTCLNIIGIALVLLSTLAIPLSDALSASEQAHADTAGALSLALSVLGILGFVTLIVSLFTAFSLVFTSKKPGTPEQLIYSVLSRFFSQVVFRRDLGFSKEELDASGLVPRGNVYRANDYIQGIYRGLFFR